MATAPSSSPTRPPDDTVESGPEHLAARELFAVLGERWNYLIIREAFFGVHRFGELQRSLGISPNMLTTRLCSLVDLGLLEKVRYHPDKAWYEYRLTADAMAMIPAWVAVGRWSQRHLGYDTAGQRPVFHHEHEVDPILICGTCGEPIAPGELHAGGGHADRADSEH